MIKPSPSPGERLCRQFKGGEGIFVGSAFRGDSADLIDKALRFRNTGFDVGFYLIWDKLRPADMKVVGKKGMIGHGQEFGSRSSECQNRGEEVVGVGKACITVPCPQGKAGKKEAPSETNPTGLDRFLRLQRRKERVGWRGNGCRPPIT